MLATKLFPLFSTTPQGRELPKGRTLQIWEIFCEPFGNGVAFCGLFLYNIKSGGA